MIDTSIESYPLELVADVLNQNVGINKRALIARLNKVNTTRGIMKLTKFKSGAIQGKEARFDLITPVGLRRIAETCGEGSIKFGDENWLKGIDTKNLMNHALTHLNKYMAGDKSEDHLAQASWNLF